MKAFIKTVNCDQCILLSATVVWFVVGCEIKFWGMKTTV